MSVFLSVIAALLLDALLGEPKRGHPLVAFGRLADRLERHFNGAAGRGWRSHGVTAWCLAVLPLTLLNLFDAALWRFLGEGWERWVVCSAILLVAYWVMARVGFKRKHIGPRSYRYAD